MVRFGHARDFVSHLVLWRVFHSSWGRLAAAWERAQAMEAERRRLRVEQLAWVCKAAMAAADTRRKARAWRLWRQVQVSFWVWKSGVAWWKRLDDALGLCCLVFPARLK